MLKDFTRIKHLIIGAVVGAFLALTLAIPRADAQAGRAHLNSRFIPCERMTNYS